MKKPLTVAETEALIERIKKEALVKSGLRHPSRYGEKWSGSAGSVARQRSIGKDQER